MLFFIQQEQTEIDDFTLGASAHNFLNNYKTDEHNKYLEEKSELELCKISRVR